MTKQLIDTNYMIIQPSSLLWGCCEVRIVKWPAEPGYEAIAEVVKPLVEGDLERVSVLWNFDDPNGPHEPLDMFVNDVGAINGKMPINPLATMVYHSFVRQHRTTLWAETPPVFGPAVLFKRQVWF